MKWWGALSCLLVSQGLALGPGGPSQCHNRCLQVYSVHTNEFDQNPALEACQRGCEFFSRIEFRNGVQEPLNSLRNCNYSCDERFEGPGLPACQSGCGFHFDNGVTHPAPAPSQVTPQGPNIIRAQNFIRPEQPRPTIITGRSDQPQPFIIRQDPSRPTIMRSEPPRPTMMRSEPPQPTMMRSESPRPFSAPAVKAWGQHKTTHKYPHSKKTQIKTNLFSRELEASTNEKVTFIPACVDSPPF